jgi:hypothetical protein
VPGFIGVHEIALALPVDTPMPEAHQVEGLLTALWSAHDSRRQKMTGQ